MPADKKPASKSRAVKPATTKSGGSAQAAASNKPSAQSTAQAGNVKVDSQTGKGGSPARMTAAPAAPIKNGPASKAPPTPQVTMTLNHQQIAARAFSIWQAKGRPHGMDQQNWHEAEEALKKELARRA